MTRTIKRILTLAALAPAFAFAAGTVTDWSHDLPADYKHSYARFNNYPASVYGPRIDWATPHALGKLKLLIILPWGTAHEATELKSRIPADLSLITPAGFDKWVNPAAGEPEYEPVPPDGALLNDTANRLLSAGYRYDAIIIGKVKWSVIPAAIQGKILDKVKAGTALVWISPWGISEELRKQLALGEADNDLAKAIRETVPLDFLPLNVDFEKTAPKTWYPRRIGPPDIRVGKVGGGSVVWLDYQDRAIKPAHAADKRTIHDVQPWSYYASNALTPFLADDDLYYDYYYSILGRALYQSAGKPTAVAVRTQPAPTTVARQGLPGAPVSFTVRLATPELRDWTLLCELRNRRNEVVWKGPVASTNLTSGSGTVVPALPRLAQGTYVVDLWALQRGAVLDWASAGLIVTDTKYIDAVAPAKEFFAGTEHIRGTVKLAAPVGKGLETEIELWDTWKRLVAVAPFAVDSGAFDLAPVANPLSRAYRLVARVKEKGFVIDEAEAWVGLPSNTVDDFQFIMWADGLRTRRNRTVLHQCQEYAVTGYYDGALYYPQKEQLLESADTLAQNNLLANPYSDHVVLSITAAQPLQKSIDHATNWMKPRLEAYRRYGTLAYSTNEECYIDRKDGNWDNPEALKDYHAYLQERYGDAAKLNAVWGSAFRDVAEIGLISFMEAKTTRQPTRWLEQELHRVDRFNRVYEAIYREIQAGDPGARMSFDCTGGMDFDWPRMAKIVRSYTQAPLEAFNKGRGDLFGTWIGYYLGAMDEWLMRTTSWQYLFQGGTHVSWWPSGYAFTADVSEPLLCMQQAAEECRELESGVGKLLLSSRKRIDPILILWSNTSYYAGTLNPGEVTWEAARKSVDNLLRRIGFDYQTVDAGYIETSLAYGDTQRVLILPASQSISRRGVERIRAFAAAGGLVIADFAPAVVDEYLRPYGAPQAAPAGKVEFETCATCKGAKRIFSGGTGNVQVTCPGCGGTGQVMKGASVPNQSELADLFDFSKQGVKKVGKGYGLFLNGSPVRREEWGGIRQSLIEHGGVRCDVAVQDPLGNVRSDLRSYVFDNGRAVFLGVLPDRALNNPPGGDLLVKLGAKAHVYDVRRHQYLGETDSLKTGILPVEAKLLAFLPDKIAGLNVSLTKGSGKPGDVLELKGTLLPISLKDTKAVVRIEVTRDGKLQKAYTKNLAFQGTFACPLPLALNQAKGAYRVKVADVISGYTQEVGFEVK